MTTLYEITDNHMSLMRMVESEELTLEQVADTMEMIEGEFSDKAVSLVAVKQNIQVAVDSIGNEIKRLQAIKKTIENKQASMIEYLRSNMEASGITKIEHIDKSPFFTITLAKGRDIVSINDESKIPTDYLDIKTTMTPMKREILADLKQGKEISGVTLVKSKTSVRIK